MPRSKRKPNEADANTSVAAPAMKRKRTKTAAVADGKENVAPNDKLSCSTGNLQSATSRTEQATKEPAASCSVSDIACIFACLTSTEDPAMVAANESYQQARTSQKYPRSDNN